MKFFGKNALLSSRAAKKIYRNIKDLPIIDYHCHLSQKEIAEDMPLTDIGEVWLAKDHYKWRAMRLCGVDEKYVTGEATYKEKFFAYAEIMPKLVGNPLYYWTHMELNTVFGIQKPLSRETAAEIYEKANANLKDVTVQSLLAKFRVRYLATTDDPLDDLENNGTYNQTTVAPTFRPDKALLLGEDYLQALAKKTGEDLSTLDGYQTALAKRLDYFLGRGCQIADHGFYAFPSRIAGAEEAQTLYQNRASLTAEDRDALFGYLLLWLSSEYAKRNMLLQLHFAVIRNCNPVGYKQCGVDAGYDLPGDIPQVENAVRFFASMKDGLQPQTVIYALNDANLGAFCALTGAFPFVRVGAAWWFNDSLQGNARTMDAVAQYSALGTSLGMLTDSRSFTSYVRFDFYRRILSDYLGRKVMLGEYDLAEAMQTARDIAYYNVAGLLGIE